MRQNQKNTSLVVFALLFALLPALLISAGGARETRVDCPRGELDERYCDFEGNLVADPPTDPMDFVDPNILIFSTVPGEDPAMFRTAYAEFLEYLAEVTGREVHFFSVGSFAAQVEALRSGRAHLAGVPTGSVPIAVNQGGFIPIAMMAHQDGSYGYTLQVITQADNREINSLADVAGRTMAFVDPGSNSGFQAPAALLHAEFGFLPDEDYQTTFTGSHDNSILGVIQRDYEVAAIASSVFDRLESAGMARRSDTKIIYESQSFPPVGWGYVHNLHPDLKEKVERAFLTFDWEGTALEAEYGGAEGNSFIPITYEEHWAVIRDVRKGLAALGL